TNSSALIMTPAQPNVAGSAFYANAVRTDGLTAGFNLNMSGGTGADGATFSFLDPARTSATGLGGAGSGLGFAGLSGVSVAFVTYPQNGINSTNFVAIMSSPTGAAPTVVASTTTVPDLRNGVHAVGITVVGTTINVAVDGNGVLSTAVPTLKPRTIVGFSAGTGSITDVH